MKSDMEKQFSSRLCARCGGAAPDWKCPACGMITPDFDPSHFRTCIAGGKLQALCQKCNEAESKCACEKADR